MPEDLANDIGSTVSPESDGERELPEDTALERFSRRQRLWVTPDEQLQGLITDLLLEGGVSRQPSNVIRHRHAFRKHTQKHLDQRFRGATDADDLVHQGVGDNGTLDNTAVNHVVVLGSPRRRPGAL